MIGSNFSIQSRDKNQTRANFGCKRIRPNLQSLPTLKIKNVHVTKTWILCRVYSHPLDWSPRRDTRTLLCHSSEWSSRSEKEWDIGHLYSRNKISHLLGPILSVPWNNCLFWCYCEPYGTLETILWFPVFAIFEDKDLSDTDDDDLTVLMILKR
jgi:hypothetical protein